MDPSFSGRVALITGASGGIGQALARRLAVGGAALGLGYGTNGQAAQALAAEITAAGGTVVAIGADLRRPEAPGELVQVAAAALGPVDVLVSNAGLSRVQPLEDISAAQFDEMLAVNLRAPFLLAQSAVPSMRERGFGRILFISSVAAFTGGIVGPHYAASKAGLHGLTHFLASPARHIWGHGQRAGPGAGRRDRDAARRSGRPAPAGAGRQARPAVRGCRSRGSDPGQRLLDQPGHLPRRRHPPQVDAGQRPIWRPDAPASVLPITVSAATHDRHQQDDDRYAA
jgi:3-oxoacyl-[acyl-carrier protein] reductase